MKKIVSSFLERVQPYSCYELYSNFLGLAHINLRIQKAKQMKGM